MSLNGKVIVLFDKYDINIASHSKYSAHANKVMLVNRTENNVVIEAYFSLMNIAYVINASLGDSLFGATFQPFNIIP